MRDSLVYLFPRPKHTPSGEGEKRRRGKEKGIGEVGGWNW